MTGDDIKPDPTSDHETPDTKLDPEGLKDALGRTGRMLKTAGLPFEEDEFEGDEAFEQAEGVDTDALATGVDAGEAPGEDADADDDSSSSSSEDSSSSSEE
jgi:hypothetical protein